LETQLETTLTANFLPALTNGELCIACAVETEITDMSAKHITILMDFVFIVIFPYPIIRNNPAGRINIGSEMKYVNIPNIKPDRKPLSKTLLHVALLLASSRTYRLLANIPSPKKPNNAPHPEAYIVALFIAEAKSGANGADCKNGFPHKFDVAISINKYVVVEEVNALVTALKPT
jgi:hypothetical protein